MLECSFLIFGLFPPCVWCRAGQYVFLFQLLRNVKESFFDSVFYTTGKLVLSLVTPGPGQAVLCLPSKQPHLCVWQHGFEWKLLSHVRLFTTPWTIQFMEFSRLEYWCVWPFPSPGNLPNPGIEPRSPSLQADSLPAEPQGKPIVRREESHYFATLSLMTGQRHLCCRFLLF